MLPHDGETDLNGALYSPSPARKVYKPFDSVLCDPQPIQPSLFIQPGAFPFLLLQ